MILAVQRGEVEAFPNPLVFHKKRTPVCSPEFGVNRETALNINVCRRRRSNPAVCSKRPLNGWNHARLRYSRCRSQEQIKASGFTWDTRTGFCCTQKLLEIIMGGGVLERNPSTHTQKRDEEHQQHLTWRKSEEACAWKLILMMFCPTEMKSQNLTVMFTHAPAGMAEPYDNAHKSVLGGSQSVQLAKYRGGKMWLLLKRLQTK